MSSPTPCPTGSALPARATHGNQPNFSYFCHLRSPNLGVIAHRIGVSVGVDILLATITTFTTHPPLKTCWEPTLPTHGTHCWERVLFTGGTGVDAYWRVDAKPKCTYSTVSTFPTFCTFSCAFHVHYVFQGGMQNGGWMQIPDAGFLHVFYVSCVFYASNPVF